MTASFTFVGKPQPINKAITANTATTIADATNNPLTVPNFEVNENGGGTQNLTVEIWDGTTHLYLSDDAGTVWNAHAVTAYKGYKFSGPYAIPKASVLRVTSSDAAGKFTVIGNVLATGNTVPT